MSETTNNALVLFKASELDIEFPPAPDYVPQKVALATQTSIVENGSYTPDGTTYVDKSAIPQLLGTDGPGANQFYNDLPDADKLRDGTKRLVRTHAVIGEVSRRIEEPFPADKVEKLKHTDACLRAYRDHPELERRRTVKEAHIRQEWPDVKKQARAGVTNCEVTGQPLEPTPHVHHLERRADKPSLTMVRKNLLVTNPAPHGEIHAAQAHTPEQLDALAREKGWPWRKNAPEATDP